MVRVRPVAALLLALAVVVLPACGGDDDDAASSTSTEAKALEPIKVGVLIEFSGAGADYGKRGREMITMALDEVENKVAGHPIEVIYEDTQTDPGVALQKAKKLIEQDHVDVVVGPNFSNAKEPLGPYLASQQMVGFPLLGAPYSVTEGKNMITYPGSTESFCRGAGTWAAKEGGFKTMETIGADYNAGRQLINPIVDDFKANGGKLLAQQWAPIATVDYAPYITALKGADVVSIFTLMPGELALLKQYFELGAKGKLLICEGDNVTPEQLKQLGTPIVGAYGLISAYSADVDTAENKKFVSAVQKRFRRVPNIVDGSTYTSMRLLIDGLEASKGETSLDSLYPAVTKGSFSTPMGDVTFTPGGLGITSRYVARVNENYEWETIHTLDNVVDPRDDALVKKSN